MLVMASINLSGMSDDEIERMRSQAENENLSLARWCRYRIRAGDKLWDASGNFDISQFDEFFQSTDIADNTHELKTGGPRLRDTILANLSTTEATSIDDITSLVVDQLVAEALDELHEEGSIRYSAKDEGYRKT